MTLDRILWLAAAICWFIGGLRAMIADGNFGSRLDWWLLGLGFVALTFVF